MARRVRDKHWTSHLLDMPLSPALETGSLDHGSEQETVNQHQTYLKLRLDHEFHNFNVLFKVERLVSGGQRRLKYPTK